MESDPYEEAVEHLLAARRLLAHPAAHARTLAKSGSPRASQGAQEAREQVEQLRSRLRVDMARLGYLEEALAGAQDWHDRYEQVLRDTT